MSQPSRKHSVEERAAFLWDPARLVDSSSQHDHKQRRLKQEGISRYEDSRKHQRRTKRNGTDNDEISVVSASKRPKALKGHNKFDNTPHWRTPTRKRIQRRPNGVYVPDYGAHGASPTSTIDSPLGETRRWTHSNLTNNDSDSESEKDVGEKSLIGSRVAVKRGTTVLWNYYVLCYGGR